MKTNTRVRQDSHGLYIRAGGHVFRPYAAKYAYTIEHACNAPLRGETKLVAGQDVLARHKSQTPFGVVRTEDIQEWWHSHGDYFGRTSDECWDPA